MYVELQQAKQAKYTHGIMWQGKGLNGKIVGEFELEPTFTLDY